MPKSPVRWIVVESDGQYFVNLVDRDSGHTRAGAGHYPTRTAAEKVAKERNQNHSMGMWRRNTND